ncbi:hypothetical protein [Candidatus Methylacidithermus pantelleriae]|uniref:DUF2029 domain-containing protein n=1 Tax=Candidatus Methylacidithermus pantelleriae TaxID=2744239 RepID=A0A8J2BN67_9BACT|nr:hypothetical protein [Candidatus Methylacidithermus pantelleriae]CAF0700921.1 conserved membrane hypothetical protein [Candidatus Methylacidithermus pantelleriae]
MLGILPKALRLARTLAPARFFPSLPAGLWISYTLLIALLVATNPTEHTVTPTYARAMAHWWASQEVYPHGPHGFLYLPQAVWLFTPFFWGPWIWDEILWRAVGLSLLAGALHRLSLRIRGLEYSKSMVFLSLLVIPASLASARNGQTNLWLAGLWTHGWLDCEEGHPFRALLWFYLGLACKPLGVVPLVVAFVLYPSVRLPALKLAPVFFLLPFLHPDPGYVAREYARVGEVLVTAAHPGAEEFANLGSLLWRLGILPSPSLGMRIAMVMGAFVLALITWHHKHVGSQVRPVWILGSLATYLMLWNPRTEENSYVILAVPMAFWAIHEALEGQRIKGCCTGLGCLLLGIESYGLGLYPLARNWLKPLVALAFLLSFPGGSNKKETLH